MALHFKQYQMTRLVQEISATSVIAQGFALYLLITYLHLGITETEWSFRDPVLNLLPANGTVWVVFLLSLSTMIIWRFIAKPTRQVMVFCLQETMWGLIVAVLLIFLLRFLVGATLPAFIPTEETAKPGIVLNMAAGYGEEVFFRLLVLPALFFSVIKIMIRPPSSDNKMRYHLAVLISAIALGLIFAALHQIGTLSPDINWAYFTMRTLMPGFVLSLLFFYRSPTFAVVLHSTSHIMIPFAFLNN